MQIHEIKIEDVVKGIITIPEIIVSNWNKCSFEVKNNVKFIVTKDGEDVTVNYKVTILEPVPRGYHPDIKNNSIIAFKGVRVSVQYNVKSRELKETSTKTR